MSKPQRNPKAQVLLFPQGEEAHEKAPPSSLDEDIGEERPDVVISGTFRKDIPSLRDLFNELLDLRFRVLSPSSVDIVSERDGFVYMKGEESHTPEKLETRHLDAISRAQLVWLHAPDGYVGPSAALEIGFARAAGIPVYTKAAIVDPVLRSMVNSVSSPRDVARLVKAQELPPPAPAVQSFQAYYAKAAIRRGYENESAQNCLVLMLEEFGELARAVRKSEHLKRSSAYPTQGEADELADIFIYVVHMANIIGLDLANAVHSKENSNIKRWLGR
jgi:NTP pyrophosphatase (non-canonical NTP hydrolase)